MEQAKPRSPYIYPGRRNWRHVKVYDWLLWVPGLTPRGQLVYGLLVRAAGNSGVARGWSYSRIAEHLLRSEEWVRQAVTELVDLRLIERSPPVPKEKTSRYRFLDHPLVPGSYGQTLDETNRRHADVEELTGLYLRCAAQAGHVSSDEDRQYLVGRFDRLLLGGYAPEMMRVLLPEFMPLAPLEEGPERVFDALNEWVYGNTEFLLATYPDACAAWKATRREHQLAQTLR